MTKPPPQTAATPDYTAMPVQLSAQEFKEGYSPAPFTRYASFE